MEKSKKGIVITASIIILVILAIFILPINNRVPVGAPLDFYDIAEEITEKDALIYYIGNSIPFPDELKYIKPLNIFSVPSFGGSYDKFIIIDFKGQNDFSEAEANKLITLYTEGEYFIILMNYKLSYFDDYIDINDKGNDIVILDYNNEADILFSSSMTLEFPTEINIQYILMHTIHRKIFKWVLEITFISDLFNCTFPYWYTKKKVKFPVGISP